MRAARLLAAIAVAGCGRLEFDLLAGDAASCTGTTCGRQCEVSCFPLELYRGTAVPREWGMAAAAIASGEVHLLYIDPITRAVMWMYSDATLRHWSSPVELMAGIASEAEVVTLLRHDDRSLTALVLDTPTGDSRLFARLLEPASPGVWQATRLDAVPLPATSTQVYRMWATALAAGNGGVIALAPEGSDTQPNRVYLTASIDRFASISGINSGVSWDTVATSTSPSYFIEVRVAVDRTNQPWVAFHQRSGTNDSAVVARAAPNWATASPPWGDLWHPTLVVDSTDLLNVFVHQEGTIGNPQHATVTSLSTYSGPASVGNWAWASAPPGAELRSMVAANDNAFRVLWENPETSAISVRDNDSGTWDPVIPDAIGTVNAVGTPLAASLSVAPQLVAGTSHLMWRDAIDVGGGVLDYTMMYSPFTICGGTVCARDEACVGTVCARR